MSQHAKGLILTLVGVLCVVPDAVFIRLIDAPILTIAFWRNGVSGLVLLVLMALVTRGQVFAQARATGKAGIIYGIGAGASATLFTFAVSTTAVANAVFIIATLPVFAALYAYVFLGERLSRRMQITIACAVFGIFVIGYGSFGDESGYWLGDLAALSVAAIFAAGLTAAQSVRPLSMVPVAPFAYIISALLLWPFVDPMTVADGDWIYVALHGGVFIVASTALLALGPRYISSAEVALLILLESLLAPILIWIVIGEVPGDWALIGGGIILITLFVSNLVALHRHRQRSA